MVYLIRVASIAVKGCLAALPYYCGRAPPTARDGSEVDVVIRTPEWGGGSICGKPWSVGRSHTCCPARATESSLPCERCLLAPLTWSNKVVLRPVCRHVYPHTRHDEFSWRFSSSQSWSVGQPIQDETMVFSYSLTGTKRYILHNLMDNKSLHSIPSAWWSWGRYCAWWISPRRNHAKQHSLGI